MIYVAAQVRQDVRDKIWINILYHTAIDSVNLKVWFNIKDPIALNIDHFIGATKDAMAMRDGEIKSRIDAVASTLRQTTETLGATEDSLVSLLS